MVRAIVDHVVALAQALQIAQPIIARVMIKMGSGQNYASVADLRGFNEIGPTRRPPAAIAPGATGRIKPAPVGQTSDFDPMRPAAGLADAGSALEPHLLADLPPIRRIKPAHLRA